MFDRLSYSYDSSKKPQQKEGLKKVPLNIYYRDLKVGRAMINSAAESRDTTLHETLKPEKTDLKTLVLKPLSYFGQENSKSN